MATYKARTIYSYKKGKGNSSGYRVHTLFTVQGKSESAVMAEIKKKHGEQAEVIINEIKWG
ncbi:hypothetical protein [Thiocapsa imhoffii]|uniref:hypothetical protein n=1 Tax=Thiocapsa imhoffii TaxID=382777 RepID=UPI001904AD84|nr:hypothetical protein [Thiocapsa imhoffii]